MSQFDQFDQFESTERRLSQSGSQVGKVVGIAVFVGVAALTAALVFVFFPEVFPWGRPDFPEHPAVGKELPRLELRQLTGGGKPLNFDDLRGHVVLVHFFGTWSRQSFNGLPEIAAVEQEFRGRPDFTFLAVSCSRRISEDLGQLRDQTEELLRGEKIEMPIYADPGQESLQAFHEVAVFEDYPTTLLLDREGTIRGVWTGLVTRGELGHLIARLLEEE